MYSADGYFGQTKHIPLPIGHLTFESHIPYHIESGGWHNCNEKYHFFRENGLKTGHLLFFSVSDGGRLILNHDPEIVLPASSAAWLPPSTRHSYFTAPGQNWEFYWIYVLDSPFLQFEKIFQKKQWIHLPNMDSITREMEKLLHNKDKKSLNYQLHSSCSFSYIYHLLLQAAYLQPAEHTPCDLLIQNIIHEMETNFARDWNLSQCSQKYYVSVPQLIRRFRAETGMTPYAYLIHVRLQASEMLLRYTSMTVEEISRKTGFPSTSQYIMQFQKRYGTTPLKFRSTLI